MTSRLGKKQIAFDFFGRTSAPYHAKNAQHFFKVLKEKYVKEEEEKKEKAKSQKTTKEKPNKNYLGHSFY